jgi:hypothetical protein
MRKSRLQRCWKRRRMIRALRITMKMLKRRRRRRKSQR